MKYQILLSDRNSGREALIECPSNMVLEELSAIIKVQMQLPYTDYGWHRFLLKGKVYVINEHIMAEPETIWAATGHYDDNYRSSENIRLRNCFTVLGSSFVYCQDGYPKHKVRCTLTARLND